ncbi:hypothetical protein D3C73_1187520 [compost metagenome]
MWNEGAAEARLVPTVARNPLGRARYVQGTSPEPDEYSETEAYSNNLSEVVSSMDRSCFSNSRMCSMGIRYPCRTNHRPTKDEARSHMASSSCGLEG